MFHLQELHEHLDRMLKELETSVMHHDSLRVEIAHCYHHLNSAWNSRFIETLEDPDFIGRFDEFAQMPTDISAWGAVEE